MTSTCINYLPGLPEPWCHKCVCHDGSLCGATVTSQAGELMPYLSLMDYFDMPYLGPPTKKVVWLRFHP